MTAAPLADTDGYGYHGTHRGVSGSGEQLGLEDNRRARLRKLAGVIVGMSVRRVTVNSSGGRYPVGYLDLYFVPLPSAGPPPDEAADELRLRVMTHGWRIESREKVIAASSDPPDGLDDAAGILADRTVTGLRIDFPGPDTTISCEELNLRLFPVSGLPAPDGIPAWLLRTAPDCLLIAGPGGEWGMSRRSRKTREAGA